MVPKMGTQGTVNTMTLPENLDNHSIARFWLTKEVDMVLILFKSKKKKKCEICGNQVKYYTHFIFKVGKTQGMPKRIYSLCGSHECQSKAMRDYLATFVHKGNNGGDTGGESEQAETEKDEGYY